MIIKILLKYSQVQGNKHKHFSVGQELIPGLLYDGQQVGMQLYTAQEVLVHNDKMFCHPSQIRSHFTSSVIHFATGLLKELHLFDTEKKTLDAGKIPVLQHDTETQIAASCVYADMKLAALLESIDMRLRSLEMIDLFGLDQAQRTQHLTALNEHISYLNSLKQTVLRFRHCLEQFLESKRASIPAFLCDDKTSDSGLVSSFYRAIQIKGSDLCELDSMETIVYSRYISERMQKDGESVVSAMLKQFGQSIDSVTLRECEPLIWMIMQAKQRLAVSDIMEHGILKEAAMAFSDELSVPTPSRYTQNNIDKIRDIIQRKAKTAKLRTSRQDRTADLVLPSNGIERVAVYAKILS
jgi:hypothetical protein